MHPSYFYRPVCAPLLTVNRVVSSFPSPSCPCRPHLHPPRVSQLIDRMTEEGVAPDLYLLNTILDGHAKQLKWDSAFDTLASFKAQGVDPDATSYVHVLRACVGARAATPAGDAVRMMRSDGYLPDVRVYAMLLSAYAKAGRLRASLKVLTQMREEGVRPNGHVYAGLMEACVVGRQPAVALDIFSQMREQGVQPDVVSYTLLVRALLTQPSKRGTLSSSKNTTSAPAAAMPGATADNAEPAVGPESAAAAAAAAAAEVLSGRGGKSAGASALGSGGFGPARAYEVLQTMRKEGGHSTPNVLTYNALLGGCVLRGENELALKVLGEMVEARVAPTRRTYEAIIGSGHAEEKRRGRRGKQKRVRGPESEKAAEAGGKSGGELDTAWSTTSSSVTSTLSGPGPSSPSNAEATLVFLQRVIELFVSHRLQLHGDVYLAALRAAFSCGDAVAARALIARRWEEPGQAGLFPLRKTQAKAVERAEAAVQIWLQETWIEAVATMEEAAF